MSNVDKPEKSPATEADAKTARRSLSLLQIALIVVIAVVLVIVVLALLGPYIGGVYSDIGPAV